MKNTIFLIFLLSILSIDSAEIRGTVRDEQTKKEIPFANVYVKEGLTGDMADVKGNFSITNLNDGKYTLVAEIIGYYKDSMSIYLDKDEVKKVNFNLKFKAIEMKGQEVTGERADFVHSISISKEVYKKEQFDFTPRLIEPDVMRVFQLLPSVVSSSDFSSALYVRGGSPDQNLILYDNIIIFNPFHLGGVLSTFETNSVEEAVFYAGGFSSNYGNRLSSVIDIKSIKPTKEDFHAVFDLSILAANIFAESKIYKGLSVFVSARRTYFDKVVSLLDFYFPYYFYDITAKIDYDITKDLRASITYFNDADILDLAIEDTVDILSLRWGNMMTGANISKLVGREGDGINITAYYSKFYNKLNVIDIFKAHSLVFEYALKADYTGNNGFLKYKVGFDAIEDSFDYIVSFADTLELFNIKRSPYIISTYFDCNYELPEKMLLQGGVRVDKYQYFDKIHINPQFGAKLFMSKNFAFTLSLSKYTQYMTSIRQEDNSFASMFGEMWLPVESLNSAQECSHIITGLEYYLTEKIFLTAEIYKKDYPNIVYTTLRQLIVNVEHPESSYINTDAHSSGFEILLKSTYERIGGWIGYSYSRSEFMKDSSYVLPFYDKTHNLNLTATIPVIWKIMFSLSANYGTGLPYTAVIGKYRKYRYDPYSDSLAGYDWSEITSGYNESRFPAYKRVDIGFSRAFSIKDFKLKVNFNVINIFNFKNVFFYYYDHKATPSVRYDFTMLPIIPSLGVSGEF